MRAVPLIVAPTQSKETRLLSAAAVHLYRFFKANGWESQILVGMGARKVPLLMKLNSLRDRRVALFYYGHGTKSTLVGSELINRPIRRMHMLTEQTDQVNERIIKRLQDGLVYTIACDSADDLGAYLVERGLGAFVGSSRPMWIVQDLDFDGDSIPDMTELLTLGPRSLAGGVALEQAVEDYKCRALEMKNNYVDNTKYPEIAGIMEQNIQFYRVIGEKGWSLDGKN